VGSRYGDIYLLKTDAAGNGVWERTFGGTGADYGSSVRQTSDGGFILTGRYYNISTTDVYLAKTDSQGNLIWQITLGGTGADSGYDVIQTSDGGFVVVGTNGVYFEAQTNFDVYLIKIAPEVISNYSLSGDLSASVANPSSFILHPCSPNPFNPTTTISYELPAASEVSLKVYDTSGRLVTTLINGFRQAGSHEVTFEGSHLPSGIYLYRIQAGAWSATGKMALVK
jgi:hypothetical protein